MGRGDRQRAGRSGGLANSFAYRYRILKGGAKRQRRVVEKTGLRPELRQTLGLSLVGRGPRRENAMPRRFGELRRWNGWIQHCWSKNGLARRP